jgi:hypothetical protein
VPASRGRKLCRPAAPIATDSLSSFPQSVRKRASLSLVFVQLRFGKDYDQNSGGDNSLIETCKRHGHDPWAYLKEVLVRIETQPPNALHELLPQNWKPSPAIHSSDAP